MPEPPAAGAVRRTSYLEWSGEGRSGTGRYLGGLVVAAVVLLLLSTVGAYPVTLLDPDYAASLVESNLVPLSVFVTSFLAIPFLVQWVHRRPWWSVAMPRPGFRGRDLGVGFLVSTLVGPAVAFVAGLLGALELTWVGFDWATYLPLLLVGGVGLFVQTGSEELFFRGYLTQFLRRLSARPVVFITVPALLYAAPHVSNVAAPGGGSLVLVPYVALGLLYGWAAYRSGSLWMSLGLHWSNSFSSVLLVGAQGDVLRSVAPVQLVEVPDLTLIGVLVLVQCVLTVAVLLPLTTTRR